MYRGLCRCLAPLRGVFASANTLSLLFYDYNALGANNLPPGLDFILGFARFLTSLLRAKRRLFIALM